MKLLLLTACAVQLWAVCAVTANTAPIVNAGSDTTLRVGYTFRMLGSAVDDNLPSATLQTLWRQVGGPAGGVEVILPSAVRSLTRVNAPGVYDFELSASDGELAAADTVRITVLDSMPFIVLSPTAGQLVELGSVITITWQIDPVANVLIELSTDGGENFTRMVQNSIAGQLFEWHVRPELPASDDCILQVINYYDRSQFTYSSTFSLVASGSAIGESVPKYSLKPSRGNDTFQSWNILGRIHGPGAAASGAAMVRFMDGMNRGMTVHVRGTRVP